MFLPFSIEQVCQNPRVANLREKDVWNLKIWVRKIKNRKNKKKTRMTTSISKKKIFEVFLFY